MAVKGHLSGDVAITSVEIIVGWRIHTSKYAAVRRIRIDRKDMIQLDLDLCDRAQRGARRQQSREGCAVDGGDANRRDEVVGGFGLEFPGASDTGEGGDVAVGTACAKEERAGHCRCGESGKAPQSEDCLHAKLQTLRFDSTYFHW